MGAVGPLDPDALSPARPAGDQRAAAARHPQGVGKEVEQVLVGGAVHWPRLDPDLDGVAADSLDFAAARAGLGVHVQLEVRPYPSVR
jgi:hypothetical protein